TAIIVGTVSGRRPAKGRIELTKAPGRLQVVATPIGNLSDLSERARQALAEADLVAPQDTRHTKGMLQAIGISKPIVSRHAYNDRHRVHDRHERLRGCEVLAVRAGAGSR